MKYTDTLVSFREFPDEISLCINISGCQFRCPDCHSKELWENIGEILDGRTISMLLQQNKGISCVGFMGGIPKEVNDLAECIRRNKIPVKIGWYWGGTTFPTEFKLENFDYIKIGPYIKEKGPLDNPNTNQRMYQISKMETGEFSIEDITFKFWKHGER